MSAERIIQWVVVCNGCGRELGQGYGHRETYDGEAQARDAARAAMWSIHPDGTMYCQQGAHQ